MPTTVERPDLREAPAEDSEVSVEHLEEMFRKEAGTEVEAPKKPIRWMRWMLAAAVVAAGAVVGLFALRGDGDESVTDSTGPGAVASSTASTYLGPIAGGLDIVAEADLPDLAVAPQPVNITFIPGAGSDGVMSVDRTFIPGTGSEGPEPVSVTFIAGNRSMAPSAIDVPEPVSVTFIPGNGSQLPEPVDVTFVAGNGSDLPEPVSVTFIPGGY